MRIERITNWDDLAAMASYWEAVAGEGVPVFLSWPWVRIWQRHLAKGQPWVLAVWLDGELAGLAPWGIERRRGMRWLRFLGDGPLLPDHLDILAHPAHKMQVGRAAVEHLRRYRRDWDVLSLRSIAQASPLPGLLAASLRCHFRPPIVCPYIPLEGVPDWETFLRTRISASMRKKGLRYLENLLKRRFPGQVSYTRISHPEDLPGAMETFFQLHLRRWHARGMSTPLEDERLRDFHREMAVIALERDWLGLYQLRVGDTVIATQYGFHFQNIFYDYQHAFHPDWGDYSPGRLLIAYIVAECIRLGRREYDFLEGEEAYKFSWTREVRRNPYVVAGTGLRGRLWMEAVSLRDRLAGMRP